MPYIYASAAAASLHVTWYLLQLQACSIPTAVQQSKYMNLT